LARVCEEYENMMNITLVEYRLDGPSNFSSWKSRIQVTLEEEYLLWVIQKGLPETTIDEEKEERKKDDIKARKIIIYLVRDHLLPRISSMKTTYEMYESLKNMFESNNTLIALTLKGQLQNIRHQLGSIGEIISDIELVFSALNSLPKHWEPFLQSISGREQLPTFDHLWIDCTEEEIKFIARGVEDSPHDDNHALALHTKKEGRNKRNFRKTFKDNKNLGYQRKDMSKVQCFRCDKYGHIARNCPTQKKER
jgi:hypothetical protein